MVCFFSLFLLALLCIFGCIFFILWMNVLKGAWPVKDVRSTPLSVAEKIKVVINTDETIMIPAVGVICDCCDSALATYCARPIDTDPDFFYCACDACWVDFYETNKKE